MDKTGNILRLITVLLIILCAISAQLWAPTILGINLLNFSIKDLFFTFTIMSLLIFFILGRPLHFVLTALKSK